MKRKNILLIILGIILLGLIIYLITRPEKQFKVVKFTPTSYVINRTGISYLDTIVHIGLKELDIRGISVIIREMDSPKEIDGGYDTQGYIVARIGGGNDYLIYVKKGMDRYKAIDVLSHELFHLKQYNDGDLILLGNGHVSWMGTNYKDITTIPYMEREWEKEAFSESPELKSNLLNILYE